MSITIGTLINETINDNRFRFNSFNNSNIIYLNTEVNSYKDAIINFKDNYHFGYSNNSFVINRSRLNLVNITDTKFNINNDLNIKNNLFTIGNSTNLNSNINIKLFNSNNNLIINNSNNKEVFRINNSNLIISYNSSNSLLINNNSININENLFINSNNILYINNIRPTNPNGTIKIDNLEFTNFNIINNNIKSSINIDNDVIYRIPSISIKRFVNDCNILDVFNKDTININTSNRVFTINSNGFIGISSNNPICPIDINLNNSNSQLIFNYTYQKNNDYFKINNRGFISIGNSNNDFRNYLSLNINDDNRNIINPPVLNFNLNYNRNNNFRNSNLIDLRFIAISEIRSIYNNEDAIIGIELYKSDNYTFNINSTSNFSYFSENPPTIKSVTFLIRNYIFNDTITTLGISSLIPIDNRSYFTYTFTLFDITYYINYYIYTPKFINIDINDVTINNVRINPTLDILEKNYIIKYTNYIYNTGTTTPYNLDNFILKETTFNIYNTASISIFIKERLYIEKGIVEFKNFIDTINYIYQPPSDLIYATSNQNFAISLSSDGKLALGDIPTTKDYQLYINKKSRIDLIEIFNISSIPGKNNVNFSYCNISNINKAFFNSNVSSNIYAENGTFNNIFINNIITDKINVKDISVNELQFNRLNGSNFFVNSNFTNLNMNLIIGSNLSRSTSNFLMNVNVNSNTTNGIVVSSIFDNTNPSININSYANNNTPSINLNNFNNNYQFNITNNNLNLLNNNRFIYKHNSNQNLFVIGSSNNIIFELNPINTPDNTTNKVIIGYPYRYLVQKGFNIKNWENDYNQLNTNSMFNVYGNINLASINNTPFINCSATNYPNEVINVCIGSNISRSGFILNVEGNAYFSSNISVESNIFAKGTIGNVSDIRIKENLTKIENSIEKINKINGYIYTRKDTGKIETGLVAQEVMDILPQVVNLDKSTNYYNISYGNMNGLIIEGIKELNNRLMKIEELLQINYSSNNP